MQALLALKQQLITKGEASTLFGWSVEAVGKHMNMVFQEDELDLGAVVANFAPTAEHFSVVHRYH